MTRREKERQWAEEQKFSALFWQAARENGKTLSRATAQVPEEFTRQNLRLIQRHIAKRRSAAAWRKGLRMLGNTAAMLAIVLSMVIVCRFATVLPPKPIEELSVQLQSVQEIGVPEGFTQSDTKELPHLYVVRYENGSGDFYEIAMTKEPVRLSNISGIVKKSVRIGGYRGWLTEKGSLVMLNWRIPTRQCSVGLYTNCLSAKQLQQIAETVYLP